MISSSILESQSLVANSILCVSSASKLMPDMSIRPQFISSHIAAMPDGIYADRPPIPIIPNAIILPSPQHLPPQHLITMAPLPHPLPTAESAIERSVQINTIISPLEKLPEEKQKEILNQLEYYFSPANLSRDQYMADNMDFDKYISISCLANFPKIRTGLKDMTEAARIEYITQLLKGSNAVELDASGCKVRPHPMESSSKPRDTLMLRGIDPGASDKEICSLFERNDCLPCIDCKQATPECWYVTFPTEKDAMDAYQLIMKSNILLQGKSLTARIKQRLIESNSQSNMRNSLGSPGHSRPESVSQPDAITSNFSPPSMHQFTPTSNVQRSAAASVLPPNSSFSTQSRETTPKSDITFHRSISTDSRPPTIYAHPQTLQTFIQAPVPAPMLPSGTLASIRTPSHALSQKFYQAFQTPSGQIHILSHQPQGITLVPAQAATPYGGVWPTQQLAFYDPTSGHIVQLPTMQPQAPQIILQDMTRFTIQSRVPRPTVLIAQQQQQPLSISASPLQLSSPSTFVAPAPLTIRTQLQRELPTNQSNIIHQSLPPPPPNPLSIVQQMPQQSEQNKSLASSIQTPKKFITSSHKMAGRQSSMEDVVSSPRLIYDQSMPPSLITDINHQTNMNRSKQDGSNVGQGHYPPAQLPPPPPPPHHHNYQHQQPYTNHRSSDETQHHHPQHHLPQHHLPQHHHMNAGGGGSWTHHSEQSHMFQHPPPHLPPNIRNTNMHNLQPHIPQNLHYNTQPNLGLHNVQSHTQHGIHNTVKPNIQHASHPTHQKLQAHNSPHNTQPHNIQNLSHNIPHNVQVHNTQHNVQAPNLMHNVQPSMQHNLQQSWRNNVSSNSSLVNNREEPFIHRNVKPKRTPRNNEFVQNLSSRTKLSTSIVNQFDLESNSFPPLNHTEVTGLSGSMSMGFPVDENVALSQLSVSSDHHADSNTNNPTKLATDSETSSNVNDVRSNENHLRPSYAQITQRGKDAPINHQIIDDQPLVNEVEQQSTVTPQATDIDATTTTTTREVPPPIGQSVDMHDARKSFYDGSYNNRRGFGVTRGRAGKAYYNTSRVNY